MSMKLHSEMSGEILVGVGISQLIFFCCWNRAISLSTCLIKGRHFQQAVLCIILQDTSPVCPPWIERRRAPGQPWCLNGVREGNSAASRILSWMWELAVPRAADSLARYMGGLWQGLCPADEACVTYRHILDSSAPMVTSWHWCGLCRSTMIFF